MRMRHCRTQRCELLGVPHRTGIDNSPVTQDYSGQEDLRLMESVTTTQHPARALRLAGALLGMLSVLVLAGAAHAQDVPGSKDHPYVGRMPFSWITHYAQEEAAAYQLVLGPLPSDDASPVDIEQSQTLQGRVTRIQYRIDSGMTAAGVYHQYGYAIRRGKLDTLAERKGPRTRAPGGSVWLKKVFAPLGEDALAGLVTSSAPQQRRFYAGHQVRDDGEVYVVMVVNQHTDKEVRVQVDIIEL